VFNLFFRRDLAVILLERSLVRVIVKKRPDISVHGVDVDHFLVGETYDMSPALAVLMTAAGWVRPETRRRHRRAGEFARLPSPERRQLADRRGEDCR
jgi:hypothetical protein